MNAVSEGNDPPAASVAEMTRQLSARQADVLVYNKQTATALTTSIRELAARSHIPVVGVTETIQPRELPSSGGSPASWRRSATPWTGGTP